MGDKLLTSGMFMLGPIAGISAGKGTGAFDPKKPKAVKDNSDADAAIARDAERKRLAKGAGNRSTKLSGKIGEALSATIGKTTLGGAY